MTKFLNFLSSTLKLLFIFILFVSCDIFFIEPNILISNIQKLDISNWRTNLNGFKDVLISDLHLGTRFVDIKKLNEVVNVTNKSNPDLIVICGDLDAKSISDKNYSTTEIANSLKNLKAKYGVVAVMGNHDYEPFSVVYEVYKKSGIKLLENQDYYINVNGEKVRLVGLKDLWHYKTNPKDIIGNSKNVPTIVLAHNPDSFAEMPQSVSLTLSGHTHGGEFILPFMGSVFVPSKYGNRYRNGYIVEDNKHLFVSTGVATLGYGRLLNPSEIVVLKLYAQTKPSEDTRPLAGSRKSYEQMLAKNLALSKINYSK